MSSCTKAFGVLLTAAVLFSACDDISAPEWPIEYTFADTVTLYSITRPEYLGSPSAFDFIYRLKVVVEDGNSGFDIVLAEENDELVFMPVTLFEGIGDSAAIAVVHNVTFDGLTVAPDADSLFTSSTTVPLTTNAIYVIRTRKITDLEGQRCFYYAKLQALTVNNTIGSAVFMYLANPNCEDRMLVP